MNDYTITYYGDELLARIESKEDDALFEAGKILVQDASARARLRSGLLRDSGYVSSVKRSTYRRRKLHKREKKPTHEGYVIVAFASFYAHMIEFGTRNARARPFLRPALDAMKGRMGKAFVSEMRSEFK